MKITNSCVLKHIKTLADNSINTIFSDPPYNLSSVWHFVTGRLCMKKGADFMNRWAGLDEIFLQTFFEEAFRTLKFGGYCCMFSIDRQAWVFQYFAAMAGFEVCQTLYWANISNFPKSSDAGKMLDRSAGAEREPLLNPKAKQQTRKNIATNSLNAKKGVPLIYPNAKTDLAKEFEGYKYSIAPLKKITEPLLIFRKAPKNGSVLADLLACKNDCEISPAVMDIENNRVGIETIITKGGKKGGNSYGDWAKVMNTENSGRFPCTLFLTPASAELLDSQLDLINFELNGKLYQSIKRKEYERLVFAAVQNNELKSVKVLHVERENLHSGDTKLGHQRIQTTVTFTTSKITKATNGDSGGLSRVMHHADFTQDDYDSFENSQCGYELGVNEDTFYMPTVSPNERNLGCENLLYKGIDNFYVLKKSKKGKDTRSKYAFDNIENLDIDSLVKSSKDIEKAFVKVFYDLVCESSEEEITAINFVEIANQIKEYENENAGFYLLGNGTFKVFAGAKEIILQVENVIRAGNGHPTLKSISLIKLMTSLFKQPKGIKQTVYVPFSGSGSEIIGLMQAGYNIENIIACEINPDYVEIAKHRIAYYQSLQPKETIQAESKEILQTQNTLF